MAKETVHTPASDLGEGHKGFGGSGKCHYDGEPGLPERTKGPGQIPEVTYDENDSLAKGEQK